MLQIIVTTCKPTTQYILGYHGGFVLNVVIHSNNKKGQNDLLAAVVFLQSVSYEQFNHACALLLNPSPITITNIVLLLRRHHCYN